MTDTTPAPTLLDDPEPDPTEPSPPRRSLAPVWIVVMLALVAVAYFVGRKASTPAADSPDAVKERLELGELQTAENIQNEQRALAKAKLQTIADKGRQVLGMVDALDKEIERWQAEVASLLTNERGRVLAANEMQVRTFENTYNGPRATQADAQAIRGRVQSLLQPIHAALDQSNPGYVPGEALTTELEKERQHASKAVEEYTRTRGQIEAMLASAAPVRTGDTTTLQEAINRIHHEAARIELAEAKLPEQRAREEQTLRKARIMSLSDEGESVLEDVAALETEIRLWNTDIKDLLTNDRGKLLAADEDRVRAFGLNFQQERPSEREAAALRRRVENLLDPLKVALTEENYAYEPSESLAEELRKEAEAATTAVGAYRDGRLKIEAMLAEASRNGTDASTADTLQTAIQRLRNEMALSDAMELKAAHHAKREERALRRSRLLAIQAKGDAALTQVARLEGEIDQWQQNTTALLTDDRGKSLAAKEEHVSAFHVLRGKELPSKQYAAAIRTRIESLIEPVTTALKENEPGYVPSEDLVNAIEQEQATAKELAARYKDAREQVEGLLTAARTAGGPADVTLQVAIDRLKEKYAQQQAAVINAAEAEARTKADALLAEAKREQLLKAAEHEEQRIRSETARQEQQAKHDAQQAKTDAAERDRQVERERLLALAKDEQIQAKYQPFLAKGRFSFAARKKRDGVSEPASYTGLKDSYVFTDLKVFVSAACARYIYFQEPGRDRMIRFDFRENDRPHWPAYPSTDEEWSEANKKFEEFKLLAPVWRELGVLVD